MTRTGHKVAVLDVNGQKVTYTKYDVGNFNDRDVSILKVDGTNVTDTSKRLQLPGRPASMQGRTP